MRIKPQHSKDCKVETLMLCASFASEEKTDANILGQAKDYVEQTVLLLDQATNSMTYHRR